MFQDNYDSVLFTVCADGASVIMSRINGASTQLRFVREWQLVHHCSNHRLELVIKDAYKSDNFFHLIDDMFGVIYRYFCDSSEGRSLIQYVNLKFLSSFNAVSFARADMSQFQNQKYSALKAMLHHCFTITIIWKKCDSRKWSCNW